MVSILHLLPNEDNPELFQEIAAIIQEMDCVNVIMGGDFNVVQDPNVDRNIPVQYNRRNREELQRTIDNYNLVDIWRESNPEKRCFTWMKNHDRLSWLRIDYFLICEGVSHLCTDCSIIPSIQTDHSMVMIDIQPTECNKGPGIWRLNTQLLNDDEFCENIHNIIRGMLRVYQYMDPIEKWEIIKFEMSRYTREYSCEKA